MKFAINGNYYNNKFHLPPTTGPDACEIFINKLCPADTDTPLWRAPVDFGDVENVVKSSLKGFASWKRSTLDERIGLVKKYQEELNAAKNDLIEAVALESGKPLWMSTKEVNKAILTVDILIENAVKKISSFSIPKDDQFYGTSVHFKPIGPTLVVTPFDFPCQIPSNRTINALLGGNSIILKPSEKAIYTSQLIINCFHRAGFPEGTINMINGNDEIGRRLIKEKDIKGIFFVGSKETGSFILDSTRTHIDKMVSLELSGKNTAIVHNDVDIDNILPSLVEACYSNCGQNCLATSTIVLHKDIEDEFIAKLHQKSKDIIVDHPIDFEKEPFMGPLIDQQAVETYLLFIGMAKREGVTELMRGKQLEKKYKGFYVSPSIHYVKKFNPKSLFLGSEILSPNCTIIPYSSIEEAIEITNSTEFGLVSSLFSKDRTLYEKCLQDIQCGTINFNLSTTATNPKAPLGGIKNSGNYRFGGTMSIESCVFPQSGLENN